MSSCLSQQFSMNDNDNRQLFDSLIFRLGHHHFVGIRTCGKTLLFQFQEGKKTSVYCLLFYFSDFLTCFSILQRTLLYQYVFGRPRRRSFFFSPVSLSCTRRKREAGKNIIVKRYFEICICPSKEPKSRIV